MATPAYDDRHFQEVEADKKAALNEVDETYGNMISNSDQYFNKQIDAVEQWGDKQAEIQQDNTDFAIEKLEQQKAQAQKDYTKEQSGAYVDWQKQSGEYGANAEAMAAQGMQNTGYSESSQVSMYNTYQNRVATAREVFSRAVLEYDNAMKEARLQNNAILAEIAADTLQQKLELSLEGFQYKNSLIIEKQQAKQNIENTYYNRYLDVLDQINRENALEEEQRQFDLNLEMKNREFEEGVRQFNEELARAKEKDAQTDKPIPKPEDEPIEEPGDNKDAYDALNQMIASGVSKSKISNEINLALENGVITKKEALELKKAFTPRGYTY